jgi:hypothetical protein
MRGYPKYYMILISKLDSWFSSPCLSMEHVDLVIINPSSNLNDRVRDQALAMLCRAPCREL